MKSAAALRRRPVTEAPITTASLKHARRLAAVLVQRHGEVLLPIFRRLDAEVAALEQRESLLERVEAIARGDSAVDNKQPAGPG